ncbi:MAG TPA: response regulator [Methylomirabilota bacterium]|nr:response regulator [Methylomirabilota bacterium]
MEDDWDARELYGRYLRSHGMQVEAATDGVQALRLAETLHPDIVVMDLSLPHLDGWEATRRLRHDPRTRYVPIIACSGHVFGTSVDLALDAGCDAYVVKPCLPKDLLAEIRRLLAGGPS